MCFVMVEIIMTAQKAYIERKLLSPSENIIQDAKPCVRTFQAASVFHLSVNVSFRFLYDLFALYRLRDRYRFPSIAFDLSRTAGQFCNRSIAYRRANSTSTAILCICQ